MAAVIDCPDPSNFTTMECKLDCFRAREHYRHQLRPLLSKESACAKPASCKEKLAALKSALELLATGQQTKAVAIDGKSYSNHPADLECLKELIYELECECGKYALKLQKSCSTKPAMKNVSGCGCGGHCGCGCGGCGCGCMGGGGRWPWTSSTL